MFFVILRPYSKSKLELNSKKVGLEWCKTFSSELLSFFFRHQFEYCQFKLE